MELPTVRITDELPDETEVTLTLGALRRWAAKHSTGDTFEPVNTTKAATITGESERTMRNLWHRWERIQLAGGRPEVRVCRKTSSPRSDLLYDQNDLYAYRRSHGGGPRVEGGHTEGAPHPTTPSDPNDVEGIVNRLLEGVLG